jgi:hypothetical protein
MKPLMRSRSFFRINLLAAIAIVLFSCSKKTEEFASEPLSDYTMQLQPGKFITYRLDSLVFTNFGRNTETHRYQVKHLVDAEITDNLGRPAYRIFTFLRDSAGTGPWTPNGSYFITPLTDRVEVTEDNLRFIKLHLPVKEGYEWLGNKYFPTEPYISLYDFSNDVDIKDWIYYYDTFEPTYTYQGKNYTDVITVEQQDEGGPVTDPRNYTSLSRSVEKYSKNIGPIYRKYELWEYQPNPSGPSPFKLGFGIVMWMIDHN